MRLLVTGGLGGIGWEILQVAESAERVVSISRSPAGERPLPAWVTHETGSVLDEDFVSGILQQHQISHILHTAGTRTQASENDPAQAMEVNAGGTEVVLRAARAFGTVQRIVHFSTAAVYGQQDKPVTEEQPLAPPGAYA